jgi:cell division protein FtsW
MKSQPIAVSQKRKRKPLHLGLDVWLMFTVAGLLAFGLLMLYSASWEYSVSIMGKEPSYLMLRQIRFLALGLAGAGVVFLVDYRIIKKFVIPMMLITLIMLVLVIYLNEVRLGARRGLFQGSIQPSELAKLVVIIYLAAWLHSNRDFLHEWTFGILPMAFILGFSSFIIMLQPDLSAAVTIFLIGGLMFFMGGGEIRQIVAALGISLLVGILLIQIYPTGRERVSSFIAGIQDPKSASYHVVRSFEAIVRGGVFGVGIGRSSTKFTGLPVAPTDSIFAVIAEETGILGASLVIILYILLLWRGLTISNRAPDAFGKLLAAGITVWIFIEAIINMSVLVNLIPFAGNALPFMSYGGSNLTTVLVGIGIIQSVARRTAIIENEQERKPLHAVVNLRRDDGRRGISRARRSSGAAK